MIIKIIMIIIEQIYLMEIQSTCMLDETRHDNIYNTIHCTI